MTYRKIGGLHWLSLGRLRIAWCIKRPTPRLPHGPSLEEILASVRSYPHDPSLQRRTTELPPYVD